MASKKRQQAKKLAAQGASAAKIKRKTGVRSQAANKFVAKAAAAPTSTSTSTSTGTGTTPEIKGVRQGLRIAGAGGISAGDLRTIQQASGKSGAEIIQKLDKINKNLKGKDKTGISLNAGAANRLIKKATKKQSRTLGFMPTFGEGRIGKTLTGMLGTPGSSGRYVKGELVGARDAVAPTLLAGGMQIRPGGRERVQGFGKQYELPERFKPKEEVVVDPDTGDGIGDGIDDGVDDFMPPPPPEEEDKSLSSGAGGLDLASWATGFRRARSSRQRAGRKAQGTGSMKNLKFKQQFT